MKDDKKREKVLNKKVDIKFKTKSGKIVVFKAIATSIKAPVKNTIRKKKS